MWFVFFFLSSETESVSLTAHLVSYFDAPGEGVISHVLDFPLYTIFNCFVCWLVP